MKTFTIGKKKIVLKEEWMVGFITTWIVGLLAHAYRFFNFLPIWDSIYNLRESVLPIPWDAGS